MFPVRRLGSWRPEPIERLFRSDPRAKNAIVKSRTKRRSLPGKGVFGGPKFQTTANQPLTLGSRWPRVVSSQLPEVDCGALADARST